MSVKKFNKFAKLLKQFVNLKSSFSNNE